jgi:cation diffusion facilitator CzcD-associated flavoprotein CzcO
MSDPTGPRAIRDKTVAVIGAGASGLCTAKYLKQAGFDNITIFEIGSQIGGMWCYENDNGRSSAYKTLHINTAKNLTNFSDFPFDDTVQFFPSHWDMHRYLVAYAEHFGLKPLIRFKTPVANVVPLFTPGREPPRWRVDLAGGGSQSFDYVIVASGHLSDPYHVAELQRFAGEYLHSHHYREPAPYVGKRVCIIGAGNSAFDIASDVCVNAPHCVLVARSGVLIAPKLILGHPFTDVSMTLFRDWIPEFVRNRLLRFLVYLVHGRMTELGFKPLTKRTHPTSNATIVQHIAYDRVVIKTGISGIEGRVIRFDDGTEAEFDTLIAATGYKIDLPFIPPEIVPVTGNRIELYKRMVPPNWPGLYFVGMFNTTTALNQVFEWQAQWIAEILLGNAAPPSPAEMMADIEAKQHWIAGSYQNASPRHTIEEEHLPYRRELRQAMKRMRSLAARAPTHAYPAEAARAKA